MSPQTNKLGLHLSVVSSLFGSIGKLSQEAEESGYSSVWVAEVAGPNAFVALAPCAMATRRVELATGVVPIQIRTPCVLAMETLALNELSSGRAIAGLGVSSPVIVERWHGVSYRKPVTAMRECVHIHARAIHQQALQVRGQGLQVRFPPQPGHRRSAVATNLSRRA